MSTLKADYYASSPSGYVKYKDVQVDLINPHKQLEVYSRCNEILPYQLHPLEFKHNLQPVNQNVQLQQDYKTSINRQRQGPYNIMQREQVLSVHVDQKRNNNKINKTQQKQANSTRNSTITIKNVPKSILKHSMNQFEPTRHDDGNKQKNYKKQLSERNALLNEVQKEKVLRQNIQTKYQDLLQTLIKNKLVSFNENDPKKMQEDSFSEDMQKTKYKVKYHLIDKNQKQHSWGQNSSQKDYQTFRNQQYRCCQNNCRNLNNRKPNSQQKLSALILGRLEGDIKSLNQRISNTSQLVRQHQLKYQEDKMVSLLAEKDKQIQDLQNYNSKLKYHSKLQKEGNNSTHNSSQESILNEKPTNLQIQLGQKVLKVKIGKKQSFLVGFALAILVLLIISSFKSAIC